ncbi:hypothetical protein AGMMS49574_01790 [Bacteroidia bacterium]|nr:hypothetical protein AGMMS49574_01790 [Bacteroidia bacterium]
MEESNNMYSEAILGMLSEMSKKLDAIQANSKAKEAQPIIQEVCKSPSLENIDKLVDIYSSHMGKFIEKAHKLEVEKLNTLLIVSHELKQQIKTLPVPEKVSLQPLIDLFHKPKKVIICGFEFLRTSVIIVVLGIALFLSVTINIKQIEDYQKLKTEYIIQSEYIQQMQETEKISETPKIKGM